ncbi:NAD-dependent epimerase/dehydratase family protein [Sorangium sp. So ce315]|uniref:NAD-dependent epimerase/dehydratase family protein n=1 Tax=Sorangium sp. So ce315 TaxID=3133299 RepID=UPI003F63EAD9
MSAAELDARRANGAPARPALITGGAGFVGSNVAHRLALAGESVILFDNLSRPSVARNVEWLKRVHGDRVTLITGDVRDAGAVADAVRRASSVFHFAAQVAVTTSLVRPVEDFEINARGTLNVLEAIRAQSSPPPLLFTSTNKVYGGLPDVPLQCRHRHYEPEDPRLRAAGISEARPLDFHSPYGCSKGTADQYVIDYARTFGLPAAVFRMSCIYGPRQFGTEDQGWVAHFLLQALRREPITLYGDGMQVRDVLFIDDLVDAFLLARKSIRQIAAAAFNIGGGPENTMSLLELLDLIEELDGERPATGFEAWRPGDQRYYVSDCRRFCAATGWWPRVRVRDGVRKLYGWLREMMEMTAAGKAAAVQATEELRMEGVG